MTKFVRIDLLPQAAQDRILKIRDRENARRLANTHANGYGVVTIQQLDRVTRVIERGRLTGAIKQDNESGWEATNEALAMGRMALRFFQKNPDTAKQFSKFIKEIKAAGVAVSRGGGRHAAVANQNLVQNSQ